MHHNSKKEEKKHIYTLDHAYAHTVAAAVDINTCQKNYKKKPHHSNKQNLKFPGKKFKVNTQTHYIFMTEETKETSRCFDETLSGIFYQNIFFFDSLSMCVHCVCVCVYVALRNRFGDGSLLARK